MGYYTEFRLEIMDKDMNEIYSIEDDSRLSEIKTVFNQIFNSSLTDDYDAFSNIFSEDWGESWKWYSHFENMQALAKAFPNYYFTLEGQGEDREDCWVEQFHGNETYRDCIEIRDYRRKW